MSRFLEALHSGRVLLMDGAMGTELQRAGIGEGECYESWNLNHPERVRAIHQAYADAGAEVLLTNTFQGNPAALARRGLGDRLEDVLQAGLRLARDVAGEMGFVLGDVGPFETSTDFGRLGQSRQIVEAFRGADGLLVETASDDHDLLGFLQARLVAKAVETLPVVFSLTFRRLADGRLNSAGGRRLEDCIREALCFPIAALGVNCGRDIGMGDVIEIVRRYRAVTDLPIFARPNAGTPTRDGDRWVYPLTPEALAARLPELLEAGACMVGGCCGTTPEHIAACRPIIDAWNARRDKPGGSL